MRWDTPNGHPYAGTGDLEARGWKYRQPRELLGPPDITGGELGRRRWPDAIGTNGYWLWKKVFQVEAAMDADELAKQRKKYDEEKQRWLVLRKKRDEEYLARLDAEESSEHT